MHEPDIFPVYRSVVHSSELTIGTIAMQVLEIEWVEIRRRSRIRILARREEGSSDWMFLEKERCDVRWFVLAATTELVAKAEALVAEKERRDENIQPGPAQFNLVGRAVLGSN